MMNKKAAGGWMVDFYSIIAFVLIVLIFYAIYVFTGSAKTEFIRAESYNFDNHFNLVSFLQSEKNGTAIVDLIQIACFEKDNGKFLKKMSKIYTGNDGDPAKLIHAIYCNDRHYATMSQILTYVNIVRNKKGYIPIAKSCAYKNGKKEIGTIYIPSLYDKNIRIEYCLE